MKDNSWKKIWQNDTIQKELDAIKREDAYSEIFLNVFKKGNKILEAGSGLGRYCFYLESQGMECHGIEIDPEAVRRSQEYVKKKHLNSNIVNGDVRNLPFPDGFFEGYISLGVIEHFYSNEDINKVFSESYRVLKRNGYAFFSVPNPYSITFWLPRIFAKEKVFHQKIYMPNLKLFAKKHNFRIVSLKFRDFVHPFYTLNLWLTKKDNDKKYHIFKKIFCKFENIPIINYLCSGIHLMVQK